MKKLIPGLTALLLFAIPAAADAGGFTMHGSAGTAYVLSGEGVGHRTPTTLEIAPGWNWRYLRLEVPLVFGVADGNVDPNAPRVFMGVRPQAKFFPLKWLYAKLATQLHFGDSKAYLGGAVGAGFEIRFWDTVAVNAEASVNPLITPDVAVPLELRAGVTILF